MRAYGLLTTIAALLAGPACNGPGEEATQTGEACVESDLIAQCPPGSNPLLGASAESMCQVDGEVDLVENSGSVSGRCYGAGTCHVACRFAAPCPCGVDSVTRDGVYCTDCANASACGNGVCEGGETYLACPEDCAGDCTPGQERCQGTDRESCDGTGHWMRLACLEGETCEVSGGGWTLCLRNDVQRGGETGEPEPRQDRVDGRVWFGDGELPADGTGTALATPPAPNRGYVLENLAIITLDPNTGARGKDLARAGFGPLRNGELALDWKTRVHPADVDEGAYLVLYGPKRAARYSLQMGPPPEGVAENEATYPPDMAGDEGNPDVGLTFQAAFSADWKTVVWARNFYDFDGVGDPAFLPDAELFRFDARTATNVALARTGIYRLARAPLALTPDGRFAAASVTLAGGPPAVLTYDAERRGRPLVLSRAGEGGYPAAVLGVSPNGGLLATQGTGLNPAPGSDAACADGVDLWNTADGRRVYTLCRTAGGSGWTVVSLTFDPSGDRLAIGNGAAGQPTVEIWDVTTGRELATIAASASPLVRFTPDGGALGVLSTRLGGQGAPFVADLDLWNQRTGERVEAVLHWDSSATETQPSTDAFPDPTLAERYAAYGATTFAFSARGTRLVVAGGAFGAGTESFEWVATFRAGGL